MDVDSSFNQTLEAEDSSIEGQKREIKNRQLTSELAKNLAGCRLDGSTIVFDEEEEEVVESGVVVGTAQPCKLGQVPDEVPIMVNFEDENGVDEAGALREAIKNLERLQWEDNDIQFFFNQAEIKMAAVGAKKQYTKLQALSTVLPQKVITEIKKFLRKKEDEFPQNNSYKQVKNEILRIFGPKPEVAIDRALGRTLTGLPSSLARGIAEDVCQDDLDCRCCPAVVMALWKRHLPENVRAVTTPSQRTTSMKSFSALTTFFSRLPPVPHQ